MKIHAVLASLLLLVLGTEFTAPALAASSSQELSARETRAVRELFKPATESEFLAKTEERMRESIRRFRPKLEAAWQSGRNDRLEAAYDQVVSRFHGGESALMKQMRISSSIPRSERILHVFSEQQVAPSMRELKAEIRHAGGYAAFKRSALGSLEALFRVQPLGRVPASAADGLAILGLPFVIVFEAIGLVILLPILGLSCIFDRDSNTNYMNPFCPKS